MRFSASVAPAIARVFSNTINPLERVAAMAIKIASDFFIFGSGGGQPTLVRLLTEDPLAGKILSTLFPGSFRSQPVHVRLAF